MFLLFINYVKAQRIVDASCLCLPVVAAASGQFWQGKNIGDTSLYLWALIPLGGTGAHSDRVPLSLAAEAMFWGDSVVFFIVAIQADRAFGTDYCLRFLFVILLS